MSTSEKKIEADIAGDFELSLEILVRRDAGSATYASAFASSDRAGSSTSVVDIAYGLGRAISMISRAGESICEQLATQGRADELEEFLAMMAFAIKQPAPATAEGSTLMRF